MADKEVRDLSPELPEEPANSIPEPVTEVIQAVVEEAPKKGWNRRKFLTAAALGTAAAAILNKTGGFGFGPLDALANDLSGNPCTAQDVEIIGTGVVQNEPCSCTSGGTFTAHVQFTVRNNTSTGRYCIALHLPGGFGVPAQDVILKDASGSSTALGKTNPANFKDTIMFGDITGFPCNTGGSLVCIGQQGVTTGKCAANTCTTIAWNTSPGAASCTSADQTPPGGQCRHQGICIKGYGAGLTCKSGCTPTCGGTAVLTATVSGGVPNYTYVLTGDDGSSQSFGPTSATSHDFTVTVAQTTIYTLTVTDSQGCSRTATTTLNASPLAKPTLTAGTPDCAGNVTLTASPPDQASYTWFDGATQIGTGNPLTVILAPGDHSITVTVTNSAGCSATSDAVSVHVNQPVTVTLGKTSAGCDGVVTLTATGGGGNGSYTFNFTGASGTVSANTISLQPQLTGQCRTVTVTATSAGCTSSPASYSFSQCAVTTAC
jgi:hypothetical protein